MALELWTLDLPWVLDAEQVLEASLLLILIEGLLGKCRAVNKQSYSTRYAANSVFPGARKAEVRISRVVLEEDYTSLCEM